MLKKISLLMMILIMAIITESCTEKDNRKILYYVNPMDPSVRSDKPAKDPMGMDYIAIYEEDLTSDNVEKEKSEVNGYTDIYLPYEKRQLIGVKYGMAEKKEMIRLIRAVGKISHDTELYNTLQEYYNALNYYNKLISAKADESINSAKAMVDSIKFKLKLLGFNDVEISRLNQKNNNDKSLLVSDPDSRSWVEASVFETDIIYIKTGQKAKVSVPGIPGRKFTGNIITIDPVLNKDTRTVKVRILLEKTEIVFRHELYINLEIEIPSGIMLVIPEDAVFDSGTRYIVFVAEDNGYLKPREPVLGIKINDYYEVISGINENEKVVTSANFLIDSESRLKAALKDMGD